MKYHLSKDGQELGIFPLDELRRQRNAGELTGRELVWTAGMPQWQPLDSILGTGSPKFIAPPPVPPGQDHRMAWWVKLIIGGAIAMFFLCVVLAGIGIYQTVRTTSRAVHRINNSSNGLVASTAAGLAAMRPVLWNSNTVTWVEVQKQNREFRLRQYAAGYQLRGTRNPECDLLAQQFLTNWIASNFGGTANTNLPSLRELGNQLANDPNCQDPLILTVTGVNSAELMESNRRLERAVKAFADSKHWGYPKFFATVMLAKNVINNSDNRVPVLDAQALADLKAALTDGSILPGDQSILADILLNDWGSGFFERNADAVCALAKDQGEAYHWLALVLQGKNEINKAWAVRGNGWADSVSSTGWQGFNDHLKIARSSLTEAWKLNPELPAAPCLMITVSLGDSDITEMRDWFDHTTEAQLDYLPAWSNMRWGLRPRWYGDLGSMLMFGAQALKTKRFDTIVPKQYFESLRDEESELGLPAGQHIFGRLDVWPNLADMYEGYSSESSLTADDRDDWRANYAVVASLAGKYDVARKELESLDWKLPPSSLSGWSRDLSLLPNEVAARTGSAGSRVTEAESRRDNGETRTALDIYQSLASATALDARTLEFVQDRVVTLQTEQSLQGGNWVNFLPADKDLTGWHAGPGKFKVQADGSLEVTSDERGHIIYSHARLGTDFEVRGEFEVVQSSTTSFQGGLVMGLPDFETWNWYGFRIKRNQSEGDLVSFSRKWTREQIMAPVALDARTNSFYFRLQNHQVTATVNGHDLFHEVAPPQGYVSTNEFLLGLGAFNDSNDTTIRYRNIQVRKL